MRKVISLVFFALMILAALSRATGHHERTNLYTTYANRMATATAEAKR